MVTMAPTSFLEGSEEHLNLISWNVRRLPRVSRSSEAAEVQAIAENLDEMDWCRLVWGEMHGRSINLKHPELTKDWRQTLVCLPCINLCPSRTAHLCFMRRWWRRYAEACRGNTASMRLLHTQSHKPVHASGVTLGNINNTAST